MPWLTRLPLCGPLYAPRYFRSVSSPHGAAGQREVGGWAGRQAAGFSRGRHGSTCALWDSGAQLQASAMSSIYCPYNSMHQPHISPRIQHSQQAPSGEAGAAQGPQSRSQRRRGTAARPQSGAGEGASSTHSGGTAGPAALGGVRWPGGVLSTHSSPALSCWRACCRCSSPEGERVREH